MEKNNYKEDSLKFDVDAQLIRELGERLVSRNHIGISELIKNSYDADSPDVEVKLQNVTSTALSNSKLTIVDSGTGMNFTTVEKHWMTIGTGNKRLNPVSQIYGRPVTGNKGIGRFACQRLAKKLELITCAKTEQGYDHTTVHFEWDDFEPGKSLSQVKCKYEYFSSSTGKPGTTLKLKELREKITTRDFNMLLKSITFISVAQQTKRAGYEEDPGFNATIVAPEFENTPGTERFLASDKILSAGWGTLRGTIKHDGTIYLALDSKDTETQNYTVRDSRYHALSGIDFTVHIIPLKGKVGIDNRREPSLLTNETLKSIRDEYSGIKLYFNNFRVYPYGEVSEGDDWLGIAKDISTRRGGSEHAELSELALKMGLPTASRAMLNHPGTRSLIGSILIHGEATDSFVVKMDREGLVETENFINLKKVIRLSLDWATINYEAWLISARNKRHQTVVKRFEQSFGQSFEDDKSRFIKAIETLESNKNLEETPVVSPQPASLLKTDDQYNLDSGNRDLTVENHFNIGTRPNVQREQVGTAKELAVSQYEAIEAENELLRAVSATAPLLFVFAHEVKGIAHSLLSQSTELKSIAEKIDDPKIQQQLLDMANNASHYKKAFDDLFELFDVFSDSASNTKKKISFSNLFARVNKGFRFFIEQFGISLTFSDVNPRWMIPRLNQAEAYSVLINLLSNGIKSLIASEEKTRKLHVELSLDESQYTLTVKDNGIGLSEEHWEKVFEARTFDPEGKLYSSISSVLCDEQLSNLGKGAGLGLNIVRNILRKHKGSVAFSKPTDSWNAEVKVEIGK
ncbi:sensor histidine kinase [Pseudoalteromonas piscicida]|uniref:sensor histidine kinase n=1 Tax=Pseudoalteromonas piscicida TaxID=43662 RepID=UPI0032C108AB